MKEEEVEEDVMRVEEGIVERFGTASVKGLWLTPRPWR